MSYFILDMFDNASYFLSQDLFVRDSVVFTSSDQQLMNMMGNPTDCPKNPKNTYIIFNEKNVTNHYERVALQEFAYQEEINLDWKLSDDTLTIGNYLCQKATTNFAGRNYTAWYTTKIPLMAYPYKFVGLLGTIIQITDSENQYEFSLLEITTIGKSSVYDGIDQQEKIMSRKEFWEMKKKFAENPQLKFADTFLAGNAQNDERMKKNAAARLKRENNPIELE